MCVAVVVIGCSLSGCSEPTTLGFDDKPVTGAQLEAQADDRLDATEKWAEKELAGHDEAIAKVRAEVDATRRNITSRVNAGRADIERQYQTREQWAGIIGQNAGLANLIVPGLGSVLAGAAGVALGRSGRRKVADEAWDDGKAHAEAEVLKRDAAWDAAKLDAKPDPTAALLTTLLPLLIAKGGGADK
jgi:hypothetical protein